MTQSSAPSCNLSTWLSPFFTPIPIVELIVRSRKSQPVRNTYWIPTSFIEDSNFAKSWIKFDLFTSPTINLSLPNQNHLIIDSCFQDSLISLLASNHCFVFPHCLTMTVPPALQMLMPHTIFTFENCNWFLLQILQRTFVICEQNNYSKYLACLPCSLERICNKFELKNVPKNMVINSSV